MSVISTSAFYDSAMTSLGLLQTKENTLQAQISSGNRLTASSDDPVAAAQMRGYAQADALDKIDVDNSDIAQNNLNLADTALTTVVNITQSIQTLATQAASATVNDSQRANIGAQVTALQQDLVGLANSKDAAGNALFGGETTGSAYTVDASGNATYAGTASAAQTSLGGGLSTTAGITGPQVFNFTTSGTATDLLAVVKALGTALQSGSGGQAAAQSALTQLSDGLKTVTTAQTVVGARLAWIDTTNTIRTQVSQERAQQEANVGGTDITATVTKLQQTITALQASQASFVKLSGLSLFSLIQ